MNWFYLAIAIVSEVIATSALKASNGFTRFGPSLAVVLGYATAFYFLSLPLRSIPVGVAYAVWSGAGIMLVAVIGWLVYGQKLDLPAILGMGLIVAGIVVLNCFPKRQLARELPSGGGEMINADSAKTSPPKNLFRCG